MTKTVQARNLGATTDATRKITSGATTIKSSPGILESIIINDPGQKCIVVIKDGTTTKMLFTMQQNTEQSGTIPQVIDCGFDFTTSLIVEMYKLDPTLFLNFNNNSTTSAEDLSGSNSDGTMYNMESADRTEDAERGKSLNFSGTNEYVTVGGNRGNFERTDPFSISMWINQTTQANYPNPMVHYNGTTGWYIYISPTGGITFSIVHVAGNIGVHAAAGTIVAGTWTHLIITYDGTSKNSGLSLYIDGADAASNNTGSDLSATTKWSGVCEIGRGNAGSYYIGKLDEIIIFERELAASEAEFLYRNGYGYGATDGARLGDITLVYD